MKTVIAALCATLFLAGTAIAQSPQLQCQGSVFGSWDAGGGTMIEITDCGNETPCGFITGLSDPDLPDGNNPDASLRSNPLIGTKMIYGFKNSRRGWRSGKIYNPANGKTYRSVLQLQELDHLQVKGCIGPFCQTELWKRIPTSKCQ